MSRRLPVNVDPRPDESVPSMLQRQARLLGVPVRHVYPHALLPLHDRPDARQVRSAAQLLGVPARRLRAHTLAQRLQSNFDAITGHDLRNPVGLTCPGCGSATFWARLVLVTTCEICGWLLARDATRALRAPSQAVEMQHAYLHAVRHPRDAESDRFRRLRRLITLWRCTRWPTRPSTPASREAPSARGLGSQSPEWIADVAIRAWPASKTNTATRDLIGSAMLDALGAPAAEKLDVELERQRLHAYLRRSRLTEQGIPDYILSSAPVPLAGCHTEDLGHAIARSLRREAIHVTSGHRPTRTEMDRRYGPNDSRPHITAFLTHLDDTGPGLRVLQHEATHLGDDGLHDYVYRRAVLTSLRSVPVQVLGHTSRPRTPRNQTLAAAWVWLQLTHGTLRLSPHHAGMRRELRDFDHALTPEDRLTLIEYGHEFLGAVEADVALDTRRTARRAQIGAADVG